jgi:hypothetical protein
MTVNKFSDQSIFDHQTRLNDGVQKQINDVQKQLRIPTIPLYDSTGFPDDATYGQIVSDINDPEALWIYAEDDQWHRIGAGLPFAYFEVRNFDPSGSTVAHPIDGFSTNSNIAHVIPDHSGFSITQTGIYLIWHSSQFFESGGDNTLWRSSVVRKSNVSGYAYGYDGCNLNLGPQNVQGRVGNWTPNSGLLVNINETMLGTNGNGVWQLGYTLNGGDPSNSFHACLVCKISATFPNVTDILIGSLG